ncbi:uncharacterized protein LOC123225885 isoform X2 [Mangifera indica]|uniref:uncharacterized protein LOC123225885 isoform X2 n=1 Tax=Mangifera indica TaxID=29780 RepID=UPI001CFA54A9|nr:uncharacterized protein LOC123225885 isoform X2 [Mangifera indica]
MASQVGSLIKDQNLNVHYNASAGGKTNVSKALKKGGLGGRKPLGDLSNSVQPTPNQSLKKHNSNIFSFTEKEIGASKITYDGSKKKSISKASEKPQASIRKALSDISNSGKPHLREASKKNLNAKLSVLEEEHLSAVAEEGFLHNHQECIKARNKAMDIDELLTTVGLNNGFSKQSVFTWLASPALDDYKPSSPPRCQELEELAEHGFGDAQSPQKHEEFDDLDSPTSPNHCMQWDEVNFMLIKTP